MEEVSAMENKGESEKSWISKTEEVSAMENTRGSDTMLEMAKTLDFIDN